MKLTIEKVKQVVDFYQKLVPDYEVIRMTIGGVINNDTKYNYFEDTDGNKIVNIYSITFHKGDEVLFLEEAITKLNLPEVEKVLSEL